MLLVAAAALLAAPAERGPQPHAVVRQAQATVRIVKAARIRMQDGGGEQPGLPPMRSSTIQTADGPQPAKLFEFE